MLKGEKEEKKMFVDAGSVGEVPFRTSKAADYGVGMFLWYISDVIVLY